MTVSPHLSTDTISDLLEGLLPDDEARTAEEHVGQCSDCSSVRDALVQLQDLLESQPAAAPMPDHVAARIEESLAAESQARSPQSAGSIETATASSTASEATPQRRGLLSRWGLSGLLSGRGPRLVAAAAALVVVGGVGALAFQVNQESGPDRNITAGDDPSPSDGGQSTDGPAGAAAGPQIKSKEFGSEVGGMVAQERPAAAPGAQENSAPAQGATGPDTVRADAKNRQCAADLLTEIGGEEIAQAQLARLDGQPVVIAITEAPGEGVVRAYAVAGCPGDSPKVVKQQNVQVPR